MFAVGFDPQIEETLHVDHDELIAAHSPDERAALCRRGRADEVGRQHHGVGLGKARAARRKRLGQDRDVSGQIGVDAVQDGLQHQRRSRAVGVGLEADGLKPVPAEQEDELAKAAADLVNVLDVQSARQQLLGE